MCKINMDPRSAGQDWVNSLQDTLVGPPDISDIRGECSQPIDKRVDILACPNHIHELTVRDSKLSNQVHINIVSLGD